MVKEIGNRINRLRALALGLLLSSSPTALSVGSAYAEAQIGTSAAVQGDVFVRGGGVETRATVNQSILLGDQVLTKQQSALQILLLDSSIFTVGENCSMVIDRFVYDPNTGAGNMAATVAKGAFRFMSGRIGADNPTNVTLSTPSAVIGIRGTFVDSVVGPDAVAIARKLCETVKPEARSQLPDCICDTSLADPNSAAFIVLRGPGDGHNSLNREGFASVSNSAGSAQITDANYAVFVPGANQEPCGPFPLPDELRDYLDFFLRSSPDGPPVNPIDDPDDPEDTDPPDDPPDFGPDEPPFVDSAEPPPPPYEGVSF